MNEHEVKQYIHDQLDVVLEDISFELTMQTELDHDEIKAKIVEEIKVLGYGHV